MKLTRGFTLIELLVVIAIIGLLSSVVLASLNTARNKGRDTAIKAQLDSLRTQAEMWYDVPANSSYTAAAAATCTNGFLTTVAGAASIAKIDADNGAGAVTCNVGTNAWAAQSALPGGGFWCVDSSGNSKATAAASVITDQTCD